MIGILIPEFPTQTHIFFWREIVELRRMGIEVRILSTKRPTAACSHEFAAEALHETHYLYPPRWATALRALSRSPIRATRALTYLLGLRESPLRKRLKYLGMLACAADLVWYARETGIRHLHVHSCADAAHIGALGQILGGPTYSLMLHGDLDVYGGDHADKMGSAICLTCAGPHLKEQIVRRIGYPADRVMPSWMGIDTERFCDAGRRSNMAGRLNLLTVARLDACKGHRFAIAAVERALAQGVDVRYTLIGEGAERKAIEVEIRNRALEGRVELLGTQSEDAVLDALQHADALILSSVGAGEAYPVAVMEAMSCGVPVVCSIIGSTPDMIRDGVDGYLVEQGAVQSLTDAIVTLARDPELRRRMGVAARERAVSRFSVHDITARVWRFVASNAGLPLSIP